MPNENSRNAYLPIFQLLDKHEFKCRKLDNSSRLGDLQNPCSFIEDLLKEQPDYFETTIDKIVTNHNSLRFEDIQVSSLDFSDIPVEYKSLHKLANVNEFIPIEKCLVNSMMTYYSISKSRTIFHSCLNCYCHPDVNDSTFLKEDELKSVLLTKYFLQRSLENAAQVIVGLSSNLNENLIRNLEKSLIDLKEFEKKLKEKFIVKSSFFDKAKQYVRDFEMSTLMKEGQLIFSKRKCSLEFMNNTAQPNIHYSMRFTLPQGYLPRCGNEEYHRFFGLPYGIYGVELFPFLLVTYDVDLRPKECREVSEMMYSYLRKQTEAFGRQKFFNPSVSVLKKGKLVTTSFRHGSEIKLIIPINDKAIGNDGMNAAAWLPAM